jgi:PmbA protein
MKEVDKLTRTAHEVLQMAKAKGTDGADVHAAIEDGYTVTVRKGELDSVEYHRDRGVGITTFFGTRRGSAATSDTREHVLDEVVNAACSIAKFTEEDPCAGLADKELIAREAGDLDLYHEWDITPDQAVKLALEYEAFACKLDKRIKQSEGVSIATHKNFFVYGNSHGFVGAVPNTRHTISYSLIAEQNGQMERDCDYTVACDAADLDNFQVVAKSAVGKTVARLGSRKLATQKIPILFDAAVAKGLFSSFMAAINGNNLYRQSSFLLNSLHQQVFAEHVRIYESPHIPKTLNSAYFDSEGVATFKKDFVQNGILQNYVLNSYTARKLGMQTTANAGGVFNLFVGSGELDFAGLLKEMDTGLYVTELVGQGVNIVTGDYSRGAVGFWVEKGEIQYPVSEVTLAGNLRDVFLNIVAVGNDIDHRGNIRTGSVLLEQMSVAGD